LETPKSKEDISHSSKMAKELGLKHLDMMKIKIRVALQKAIY
jgi:hypothetical protein